MCNNMIPCEWTIFKNITYLKKDTMKSKNQTGHVDDLILFLRLISSDDLTPIAPPTSNNLVHMVILPEICIGR